MKTIKPFASSNLNSRKISKQMVCAILRSDRQRKVREGIVVSDRVMGKVFRHTLSGQTLAAEEVSHALMMGKGKPACHVQ